jgi:CRP-like cAMP-binding protein
VLKWIVLAYVPLFLVFGVGLLSYEIYYKRSLTGGKSKRFKKLVASLEVPGASRTPADVKNIYQAIVESEFLKPYPYSKLATICRACELLELKPHEAVFSEGDFGDHFFVLIKGTVDVYVKERTAPHKMKCVNTLHDSGSFGELALLQVPCASLLPVHLGAGQHGASLVAVCRKQASVRHRSSARQRRRSS